MVRQFDEPMELPSYPGDAYQLNLDDPEATHKGSPPGTFRKRDKKGSSSCEAFAQEVLRQTPSLVGLGEGLTVAAAHDVTVLLNGETGTGKTFLASLIHAHSSRKDHDLLVVPCGALSSGLVESELFGHVKGAFTGADRAKVGKFEAAGKGTLLLDEIDTLSLEQQAKLLRVIETGAYEAVGSNTTLTCQARIIAASNWDLETAVLQGKFRQDLYYRLNVIAFYLPPLRDRVQDIGPLARCMASQFAAKFAKDVLMISPEALAALEAFPWPGNIRQLENVVQQAVLFCNGPVLLLEHLPQRVREHPVPPPEGASLTFENNSLSPGTTACPGTSDPVLPAAPGKNAGLKATRASQERAFIETVLQETNNCRSRAARALGISRATLYNKMRKYGITKVC
jgi:DNA-binding NtrC family response regulator